MSLRSAALASHFFRNPPACFRAESSTRWTAYYCPAHAYTPCWTIQLNAPQSGDNISIAQLSNPRDGY